MKHENAINNAISALKTSLEAHEAFDLEPQSIEVKKALAGLEALVEDVPDGLEGAIKHLKNHTCIKYRKEYTKTDIDKNTIATWDMYDTAKLLHELTKGKDDE